jgi:hypothetical protein
VVAGTALLVAAAALLAVRSTGAERRDAAPAPSAPVAVPTGVDPTDTVPPVPTAVGDTGVVSVAVGERHAYALVAECDRAAVQACAYRLHRRDVDGTAWSGLPLRMETRTTVGVFPTVAVSGDDVVTVVEGRGGRVWSSADGVAFTDHELAAGPAVDAVPTDGLVCTSCAGVVTVLEPATGRLRPLRSQPAFRGGMLRSVQQRGRVLWAVSTSRAGTLAAVSVDRGRSWRTAPVPVSPDLAELRLVVGPGGSGYLLCVALGRNGTAELTGVWTVGAPGRSWTRVPGPAPHGVRSALASDRGLLIADFGGTVWQLRPDGTFAALPDPGPTRPADLAVFGGRLVLATARGGLPDPLVLTSPDGGATWRTERL